MRFWRGTYVGVSAARRRGDPPRVWFHRCVVCRHPLRVFGESARTGIGPECARRGLPPVELARLVEAAKEQDRERYRREVQRHGFRIEPA